MRTYVVILISLVAFLGSTQRVSSDTTVPYYLYNAANKFKLDIVLLYSICKVESNCNPRAVNHDDGTKHQKSLGIKEKSLGLFQIKMNTAKTVGFETHKTILVKKGKRLVSHVVDCSSDLLKPEINSWYAAKLLRHLYNRYGDTPKVISAYNAGHYTQANKAYVTKVLENYARYKLDKKF